MLSKITRNVALSSIFAVATSGMLANNAYSQERRPIRTLLYNLREAFSPMQKASQQDIQQGYGDRYIQITKASRKGAWPSGIVGVECDNPITIAHETYHRLNFDIDIQLAQKNLWPFKIPYRSKTDPTTTFFHDGVQPIYIENGNVALLQELRSVTVNEVAKYMPPEFRQSETEILTRRQQALVNRYKAPPKSKYETYFYDREERNKRRVNQGGAPINLALVLIEEMAATETETRAALELHDHHPFLTEAVSFDDGEQKRGRPTQVSANGYFFMHVTLATICAVETHKDEYKSTQEYENVIGTIQVLFERLVHAREQFLDQDRYPRFLDKERRSYEDFLNDPQNKHLIESANRVYGEDWLLNLKTELPEPNFKIAQGFPTKTPSLDVK